MYVSNDPTRSQIQILPSRVQIPNDRVLLEFVLTRSSDGPEQDRMQIPALPCCRCRSASDILLPVIHPTTFLEFVISLVSRLVSYSSPKLASSKQSVLSLDRAQIIKSLSN